MGNRRSRQDPIRQNLRAGECRRNQRKRVFRLFRLNLLNSYEYFNIASGISALKIVRSSMKQKITVKLKGRNIKFQIEDDCSLFEFLVAVALNARARNLQIPKTYGVKEKAFSYSYLEYSLADNGVSGKIPILTDKFPLDEVYQSLEPDKQYPTPSGNDLSPGVLLHYAAGIGDMDAVKTLIEIKATIDQPVNSSTPLMFAAFKNHLAIVEILLEHNANPNLAIAGLSAFDYASDNLPDTSEVVFALLTADVKSKDPDKNAMLSALSEYKAQGRGTSGVQWITTLGPRGERLFSRVKRFVDLQN